MAAAKDDYDSEFRYGGRPIEPLQTLDPSGRVIYVGSFSKTMPPTLRLGFVVAPAPLRKAVETVKFVADWHTSLPTQAALCRFIDDGWLARHVRKMRHVYQARHQQIVATLTRDFAQHLDVIPAAVGLHVTATSHTVSSHELDAVLRRASAAGVEAQSLSMYGVGASAPAGLVIGYGAIPTGRIEEGPSRLRSCFDP